jgi:integrase
VTEFDRRNDPTLLARVLDALVDAFADRVAAALERLLRARGAEGDDSWGLVSQKTPPCWIQPDTYIEACRSGAVAGARLWRRQWLAPRDAVLAWVESESRAGRSNGGVKKGETLKQWSVRWFEARKARGLRGGRADIGRFKKWITPRLGTLAMVDITKVDIERWVEWIDARVQDEELAWKTAQNAWGLVSRAMRDALKSKNLSLRCRDSNPCLDIEPPDRGTVRTRPYLYPSEFLKLVTCEGIPLAVRHAYALAIYVYPRAGELEVLQWESVDLEHGVISLRCAVDHNAREVRAPKGKAPREFEIEPELLPLLRAMRTEKPQATRVFEPWPLDKDRADELRANLQVAGVARTALFASDATRRNLTYHDLRATGATWAAIRGDQPLRIMHRAGHKHLATTMMYVREAENLRAGFGTVFPPLPSGLRQAPRMSQGTSQGAGPRLKTPANRPVMRFGVRDSKPRQRSDVVGFRCDSVSRSTGTDAFGRDSGDASPFRTGSEPPGAFTDVMASFTAAHRSFFVTALRFYTAAPKPGRGDLPMPHIETPFDLPGAPADAAALLDRHSDRIAHAVRALSRQVPRLADYAIAVVIDTPQPGGRRRVRIDAFARIDAEQMPGVAPLAPLLADAAPEGMLHLIVLSDAWRSHTLVPEQAGSTALH